MKKPLVEQLQADAIMPGYDKYTSMCSKILSGDELAAKLLLSSMVSEVYLR